MGRSYNKKETSVNIATLKAQLAKYLRLVKSGEEVLILDHKMPVAKLTPIQADPQETLLISIKPKADFSGIIEMKAPPPSKNAKIDSLTLLLQERGSR
jgi:antitoxin (DNA-binding transcriptional repressor) of toxin-antitoxin stability system